MSDRPAGAAAPVSPFVPLPGSRQLVLLRHGRTAWNVENRGQGHTDVPLDEVGEAQAAAAGPVVASYAPGLVVTSDLVRASATARPVAEHAGAPLREDARLREFDLGERTGMVMADYAAAHPDEYAAFRAGSYDVVPGAETHAQVRERVHAALRDVLAGTPPSGTSVVVSHGGALRVGALALLGWPGELGPSLRGLPNCGWAVLVEDEPGGRVTLQAWGLSVDGVPSGR